MATHTNKHASAPVTRGKSAASSVEEWGEPQGAGGGGEQHDFKTGPLVGKLLSANIIDTQYGPRLVVSFQTPDGVRDHFHSEGWAEQYEGRVGQRGKLSSNGLAGTKVRYTIQWAAGTVPGASKVGRKAGGATKDENGDDIPF